MKKSIISALSLFSVIACVQASAEEIDSNGATVFTDNFSVVEKQDNVGTKSLLVVAGENELGSLGDKVVVSGKKASNHIAYVKHANNDHNYIIKDSISVQCVRDVDCIPSGLEAKKISRSVYELKVNNYDEWKSVQEELRNTDGVLKVAPSYEHGVRPQLK
ncbi:hypothetical protein [Ruminobacter sp.]|uniref:hypothetical protein n=1 Tax=Ruminobacter sp. TaxID=2774296 RepID=UPI0038690F8A